MWRRKENSKDNSARDIAVTRPTHARSACAVVAGRLKPAKRGGRAFRGNKGRERGKKREKGGTLRKPKLMF